MTRLEKLAKDKYSSLLRKFVKYAQKSFIALGPEVLSKTRSLSKSGAPGASFR